MLTELASRDECGQDERVARAVASPVDMSGGTTAQVSASVGVAFCPDDGLDPELLLSLADQSMYSAKRARAGTYH